MNFSLLVNLFSDQINWHAILINLSVDTADLLNIIINSLKHPSFELSTYRSNSSFNLNLRNNEKDERFNEFIKISYLLNGNLIKLNLF